LAKPDRRAWTPCAGACPEGLSLPASSDGSLNICLLLKVLTALAGDFKKEEERKKISEAKA
jgi:hypothetical protein